MHLSVTNTPASTKSLPTTIVSLKRNQHDTASSLKPTSKAAQIFILYGEHNATHNTAFCPAPHTDSGRPFLEPPPTQLGRPNGIPKARAAAWAVGMGGAVAVVFIVSFFIWRKNGKPPLFSQRRLSEDERPFLPLANTYEQTLLDAAKTHPYPCRPTTLHKNDSYRLGKIKRPATVPVYSYEDQA